MSVNLFFESLGLIYDKPDRVNLAEDMFISVRRILSHSSVVYHIRHTSQALTFPTCLPACCVNSLNLSTLTCNFLNPTHQIQSSFVYWGIP
ncbi:unnamed protein product [Ranitomeya imitator]|uniref:Uncharacterized protein n=1 Tax=Ranitomeya imitator TaxID=111125 RepID=A0ABN9KV73_9NEOB|nr:unnamed protein product [Ranitomeya imitator]